MSGRTRAQRPPVAGTHGTATGRNPVAGVAGRPVPVHGGHSFDAAAAVAGVDTVVNTARSAAGASAPLCAARSSLSTQLARRQARAHTQAPGGGGAISRAERLGR